MLGWIEIFGTNESTVVEQDNLSFHDTDCENRFHRSSGYFGLVLLMKTFVIRRRRASRSFAAPISTRPVSTTLM
jgi:hypothetical protein